MDIVDRLRERIIASACADGRIIDQLLAERLILERHEAADVIERLRSELAELRQVVAMSKIPTDPPAADQAFPNQFKI